VVDEDVDIESPDSVEWAIATRSQMDSDLLVKPDELGSSLDPSADQVTRKTAKAGLDATIPMGVARDKFLRARIPMEEEVRAEDYLE
jgi:3-polyprenyl-4-hydroxybenzoate decarboxylase